MNQIGVVVVDDVMVERRAIRKQIALHPFLSLLGEAESMTSGVEMICRTSPEVVFLDICLKEATGFDLLRELKQKPRVVFVTSSIHHGPEAFDLEAVDYLVKPVSANRFESTVQRLKNLFLPSSPTTMTPHTWEDRISLRDGTRTHLIPVSQLVTLQADGNFTRVNCADSLSLFIWRSLSELEALLPPGRFVRLDRSLIINIARIERAERFSRNLSRLWLHGAAIPLDLGRTATERLRQTLRTDAKNPG